MILPLKVALGVILLLGLGLAGTTWYSSLLAAQRDAAEAEASTLRVAVDVATAVKAEAEKTNQRLTRILAQRSARENQVLLASQQMQEKIDALSGSCVHSPDASRLLWQIYEGAGGVPRAQRSGDPASATDSGTSSTN